MPRLQIGQLYAVPGPDEAEVGAELMEAAVMDGKAYCILRDPARDTSWMGTFEMTSDELADYARHPETYFGVYRRQGRKVETSMELFDFFLDTYRNSSKEQLIKFLPNYADQDALLAMSQNELAELLAERYAMNAISRGFTVKSPRKQGGSSKGQ